MEIRGVLLSFPEVSIGRDSDDKPAFAVFFCRVCKESMLGLSVCQASTHSPGLSIMSSQWFDSLSLESIQSNVSMTSKGFGPILTPPMNWFVPRLSKSHKVTSKALSACNSSREM